MAQLPPGVDATKTPFIPPPRGQVPNFVNPPSLAPLAEGLGGSLIAIETVFLVLRTCSNVKTYGESRLEDYWVMFAAVLTYGYFALIMLLRPIARHGWDIPLSEVNDGLYKTVFAQDVMWGGTFFFSKSSLLLLYYRIFSPNRMFRYKLYGAFAFLGATTLTSIPMYLAICIPGSNGSWEEATAKCGRTAAFGYYSGPATLVFDLFLLYLPASVTAHLHMPLRRKLGILAIFMTGLLAVVAGIVGMVFRILLVHEVDATWASTIVQICVLIESCVAITCSCMPSTPAIAKLVAANTYFVTLRSRLLSRHSSSKKSKPSSNASSRRDVFPGHQEWNKYEPYIELVDRGKDDVAAHSATKTNVERVAHTERPSGSGITMSVDVEVE